MKNILITLIAVLCLNSCAVGVYWYRADVSLYSGGEEVEYWPNAVISKSDYDNRSFKNSTQQIFNGTINLYDENENRIIISGGTIVMKNFRSYTEIENVASEKIDYSLSLSDNLLKQDISILNNQELTVLREKAKEIRNFIKDAYKKTNAAYQIESDSNKATKLKLQADNYKKALDELNKFIKKINLATINNEN